MGSMLALCELLTILMLRYKDDEWVQARNGCLFWVPLGPNTLANPTGQFTWVQYGTSTQSYTGPHFSVHLYLRWAPHRNVGMGMTVVDVVPSKEKEITGVQLRLPPDSFNHFNYMKHFRGRNIQISSNISLRNIVFEHFDKLKIICHLWSTKTHPVR